MVCESPYLIMSYYLFGHLSTCTENKRSGFTLSPQPTAGRLRVHQLIKLFEGQITVRSGDGIKSCPIFPNNAQKEANHFLLDSCIAIFKCPKLYQNIWRTIVIKFVTKVLTNRPIWSHWNKGNFSSLTCCYCCNVILT